eukprot:gnl/Dysnectes_brevis/3354_a4220_312.p1 GENE.gnl/Dysnectes_brevis/3354_a4220_312~~gnl/Dysnectes_brevis/3354_a4220_312.p1  ORF type:complete len:1049 (-),score=369.65 gnl/Dysnectes_brevis/3354_a4220_312:130-3276(-)
MPKRYQAIGKPSSPEQISFDIPEAVQNTLLGQISPSQNVALESQEDHIVSMIKSFWTEFDDIRSESLTESDFDELILLSSEITFLVEGLDAKYLRLIKDHPKDPVLLRKYAYFLSSLKGQPKQSHRVWYSALRIASKHIKPSSAPPISARQPAQRQVPEALISGTPLQASPRVRALSLPLLLTFLIGLLFPLILMSSGITQTHQAETLIDLQFSTANVSTGIVIGFSLARSAGLSAEGVWDYAGPGIGGNTPYYEDVQGQLGLLAASMYPLDTSGLFNIFSNPLEYPVDVTAFEKDMHWDQACPRGLQIPAEDLGSMYSALLHNISLMTPSDFTTGDLHPGAEYTTVVTNAGVPGISSLLISPCLNGNASSDLGLAVNNAVEKFSGSINHMIIISAAVLFLVFTWVGWRKFVWPRLALPRRLSREIQILFASISEKVLESTRLIVSRSRGATLVTESKPLTRFEHTHSRSEGAPLVSRDKKFRRSQPLPLTIWVILWMLLALGLIGASVILLGGSALTEGRTAEMHVAAEQLEALHVSRTFLRELGLNFAALPSQDPWHCAPVTDLGTIGSDDSVTSVCDTIDTQAHVVLSAHELATDVAIYAEDLWMGREEASLPGVRDRSGPYAEQLRYLLTEDPCTRYCQPTPVDTCHAPGSYPQHEAMYPEPIWPQKIGRERANEIIRTMDDSDRDIDIESESLFLGERHQRMAHIHRRTVAGITAEAVFSLPDQYTAALATLLGLREPLTRSMHNKLVLDHSSNSFGGGLLETIGLWSLATQLQTMTSTGVDDGLFAFSFDVGMVDLDQGLRMQCDLLMQDAHYALGEWREWAYALVGYCVLLAVVAVACYIAFLRRARQSLTELFGLLLMLPGSLLPSLVSSRIQLTSALIAWLPGLLERHGEDCGAGRMRSTVLPPNTKPQGPAPLSHDALDSSEDTDSIMGITLRTPKPSAAAGGLVVMTLSGQVVLADAAALACLGRPEAVVGCNISSMLPLPTGSRSAGSYLLSQRSVVVDARLNDGRAQRLRLNATEGFSDSRDAEARVVVRVSKLL